MRNGMMIDVIRWGNMNRISDMYIPLWSKEIRKKIKGIRLCLCEIRLDWSNKENFICEYLFICLFGWLFWEFLMIM